MKVWVTNGDPDDLRVFKTYMAAEKWLIKKGYKRRKKSDKFDWIPNDADPLDVDEFDIMLEHQEVLT